MNGFNANLFEHIVIASEVEDLAVVADHEAGLDIRLDWLQTVMDDPDHPEIRRPLSRLLLDCDWELRTEAVRCLDATDVAGWTVDDLVELEKVFKKETLARDAVIAFLLRQKPEGVAAGVTRLLASRNAGQRLAGLDLAAEIGRRESGTALHAAVADQLESFLPADIAERRVRERVREIFAGHPADYTPANGFGFCDPERRLGFPPPPRHDESLGALIERRLDACVNHLRVLSSLLEHDHGHENATAREEANEVPSPLACAWRRESGLTVEDWFVLDFLVTSLPRIKRFPELLETTRFPADTDSGWIRLIVGQQRCLPSARCRALWKELIEPLPHRVRVEKTLADLDPEFYAAAIPLRLGALRNWYHTAMAVDPNAWRKAHSLRARGKLISDFTIQPLRGLFPFPHSLTGTTHPIFRGERYWRLSDANFADWFILKHHFRHDLDFPRHRGFHIGIGELGRAYRLGLVDEHECYRLLLEPAPADECHVNCFRETLFGALSPSPYGDVEAWRESPLYRRFFEEILDRLLTVELRRGETETGASAYLNSVRWFYGTARWTEILKTMGQSPLDRKVNLWPFDSDDPPGRSRDFSHLLRAGRPAPGEDAATLRQCLSDADLPENRLLEAAFLAPQWIPAVSGALAWPGLEEAFWFFRAHADDRPWGDVPGTARNIARYSPIEANAFRDGAFDRAWLVSALNTLGEERFDRVRQAARYLFADPTQEAGLLRTAFLIKAARGHWSREAAEEHIAKRYDKNALLAYGVIPLKDENDFRERHGFFQQLLEENQKSPKQRREEKERILRLGLDNLARNAKLDGLNPPT